MIPSRQDGAAIRSLIAMVMIGMVAHAGLPYLPLTGPPAMRVAAPKPSATATVIALEKSAASSVTNLPPVLETVAMPTNTIATNPPVEMLALPAGPTDQTFGPPLFTLTDQGLVNITPQVLATYFRPVTAGTNSGVIGGVLPIGFVPPFTRLESSRAEYIVK